MFRFGKRENQKILQTYNRIKRVTYDFQKIVLFFSNTDNSDAHQVIPYRTLQDLDFEELFMYMDRTCSRIGQQYLYTTLRTIPKNKSRSLQFEKIIERLNKNPDIKKSVVLELSRLNKPGAYYLQSLFSGKNIAKPKWFWVIPLLSGLSLAALLLSFVFPVYLLVFMPVLVINFIIHYWNKKNILTYSNSIPQLLILNRVANKLIHLGVIWDNKDPVQKSNHSISEISRLAIFYKAEEKMSSEIGQVADFLLDLIKATFLLEPILIFKIIRKLELKNTEISKVFHAVAQVDVALSISSFRERLPFYSFPEITENKKSFYANEIYHPLILNPVSNSIAIPDGKSALITGSNMSGKTTFIRTIGINTILSQTINTACAKQFIIPKLKVHSAIKISDDLLDDTSYYYEEVKTIKKMIGESETEYQNLFLLDEIFKGTNTVERISSGKAVLSYLHGEDNLVFVSTHDIELTELLEENYNRFHFMETVNNGELTFDYKLKGGILLNTNAIRILEINKFPAKITEEAKTIANQIRQFKGIKISEKK